MRRADDDALNEALNADAAKLEAMGADPGPTLDDIDFYDDDSVCWNCAGEGVVANCFEEWACFNPEDGCEECIRRCDVCRPRKPNPGAQPLVEGAQDA